MKNLATGSEDISFSALRQIRILKKGEREGRFVLPARSTPLKQSCFETRRGELYVYSTFTQSVLPDLSLSASASERWISYYDLPQSITGRQIIKSLFFEEGFPCQLDDLADLVDLDLQPHDLLVELGHNNLFFSILADGQYIVLCLRRCSVGGEWDLSDWSLSEEWPADSRVFFHMA